MFWTVLFNASMSQVKKLDKVRSGDDPGCTLTESQDYSTRTVINSSVNITDTTTIVIVIVLK